MQTNNYCISSFLTMQQYHIHTPTIYAAQSTKMNHHVQPVVADHLGEVYHQTHHLKYHVIALAQKLAVVLKRLEASENLESDISDLQQSIHTWKKSMESEMRLEKQVLEAWKERVETQLQQALDRVAEQMCQELRSRMLESQTTWDQAIQGSSGSQHQIKGKVESEKETSLMRAELQELASRVQQLEQRENTQRNAEGLRSWVVEELGYVRDAMCALQLVMFKTHNTRAQRKQDEEKEEELRKSRSKRSEDLTAPRVSRRFARAFRPLQLFPLTLLR